MSVAPRYQLRRFANPSEIVQAATLKWLDHLRQKPGLCTSFLGGRIATSFFKELVRQIRASGTDVRRAHFFWGDERCVPPDHPDSNFRTAFEEFLHPLAIASDHIHRIRGEIDPAQSAIDAEKELFRFVEPNSAGVPSLDIVILGMGEDGHVASLFPGAGLEVTQSDKCYLPVIGPKPPPQRVTLTHKSLGAARSVWVLASGVGKETALRESLDEAGGTPLARVIQSRSQTDLFTDIVV